MDLAKRWGRELRKLAFPFTLGLGLGLGLGLRYRGYEVRLRPLTRRAGDGNGQGVSRESTNDEGSEKNFGEHDDGGRRKEERITTAPSPRLRRQKRGTGVSCTATEEKRERASNLLYIPRAVEWVGGGWPIEHAA